MARQRRGWSLHVHRPDDVPERGVTTGPRADAGHRPVRGLPALARSGEPRRGGYPCDAALRRLDSVPRQSASQHSEERRSDADRTRARLRRITRDRCLERVSPSAAKPRPSTNSDVGSDIALDTTQRTGRTPTEKSGKKKASAASPSLGVPFAPSGKKKIRSEPLSASPPTPFTMIGGATVESTMVSAVVSTSPR